MRLPDPQPIVRRSSGGRQTYLIRSGPHGSYRVWRARVTDRVGEFDGAGRPQFIECNPRTVEPGNAAAAGVDLPALQIALTSGGDAPAQPILGRAGVATRSTAAVLLGVAEHARRRRDIAAAAAGLLARRGTIGQATEVLTPIAYDPGSAPALLYLSARLLLDPGQATTLAQASVANYALNPGAIDLARAATQL